jgi:uncharacterized nucleotidyltransferase DUF6036
MDREDLFHVVAAAAQITKEEEFVVIGSQAIVGVYPSAPDEMLRSIEADIYPKNAPDKALLFERDIGEGTQFHATYGYYAHSVGPETAKAPAGWQDRLIKVVVPPRPNSETQAIAWCIEAHDLVLAKLARGDGRDWDFARSAIKANLVQSDKLLELISTMPVAGEAQSQIHRAVVGITDSLG